MASWLSLHINHETALWGATVVIGILLYVASTLSEQLRTLASSSPRPGRKSASAEAAATAHQPASTPLPKTFTAYDIEQRLRAIDELHRELGSGVMSVSAAGERLNDALRNSPSKPPSSEFVAYADAVELALQDYFRAAEKHRMFSDIYEEATSAVWDPRKVAVSARNLAGQIFSLEQQKADVNLYLRNNLSLLDFQARTSGQFWTWIHERQTALEKMRLQYEKAPIYSR
ncbi:hypothetical protein QIH93_20875 [Bradyrhizobium ottawaense]|uniref:hypothetical protein n=1 Tax=Bradyrhizobium ottawaense TaxID=931866 RepID=UPI002714F6A4|nr:hypothetical protein [Bradyrhizobium ottawaense]WLB43003.1 hypothetical protein QIH93_20875 [Bradyrhizobium ottawaense]